MLTIWKGVFLTYWCEGPMEPWPLPCTRTSTKMFSISKRLPVHVTHSHRYHHLQQHFHYYPWAFGNWMSKETDVRAKIRNSFYCRRGIKTCLSPYLNRNYPIDQNFICSSECMFLKHTFFVSSCCLIAQYWTNKT